MGYLATKVNWWLHMTLSGYDGSTNGRTRVSGALPDDRNEASERGVWEGCVVAGNIPQESPYITMAMRLCEAAEPTNTPTNATRSTHTQPRFAQPHSSQRPAFSTACRLPAGTHGAAQPTRRQQPRIARAGRTLARTDPHATIPTGTTKI